MNMRKDADEIIRSAIAAVMPDEAVKKALEGMVFPDGRLIMVAAGKAAWQMGAEALTILGGLVEKGVIVTKYGHSRGALPRTVIFEAGHPLPDENSFRGTQAAIDAVSGLTGNDTVLFLVSGGGSALFEKPVIDRAELEDITRQLLAGGADITELNTIRKRVSAVKGGRFAKICAPARVYQVILSDVIGDRTDMIASGPACPDTSTRADAERIAEKYKLRLTEHTRELLKQETPKVIDNVDTAVAGSVKQLCAAAEEACGKLGYEAFTLTDSLSCEAREAGRFMANIAQHFQTSDRSLAFIAGGETVVHLTGSGKGGRNQELALAAAPGIAGFKDTAVFSVGSDGTDGPTDAAGGFVDGNTFYTLARKGIDISSVLADNDSYHALSECGGLIVTGPTLTNVNDVAVLLIRR